MRLAKIKQLGKKYIRVVYSMFPSMPKRARMLGEDGQGMKLGYILKDGTWTERKCANRFGQYEKNHGYVPVIDRTANCATGTDIRYQTSLAAKSRAMDAFYEQCLRSGRYTHRRMLIVLNPYGLSPLTALILFRTKESCRVQVEVVGRSQETGLGNMDVSGIVPESVWHRVPVAGLYPGRKNKVKLTLYKGDNPLCTAVLFIRTSPLPSSMKNMVSIRRNEQPSSFGLTFVYGGDTRYPYAFDRAGKIRFYIERQPKPYGLHFLSNGHFLFAEKSILMPSFSNPHSTQALEMDILGRVHHIYNIENGLHHDANELEPGGNILAAGSTLEHSNEDMVLELDRKTGTIVKSVKLTEIFDKTYQDGIDWVHLNTVSYDAASRSVIVCCRNIHTVAKINWDTGELDWVLCHPKFWQGTSMEEKLLKPTGGELKKEGWPYQAHAAYLLEEDLDGNPDTRHLIIYDNHWHKRRSVKFFDGDPHSFVRIYEINEKERTVSLWKNFVCEKSKIRSNGILCREAGRVYAMSGFLEPPIEGYNGAVNEYDFQSGELINQYLTRSSYYRAYELPLNFEDLAEPMEQDGHYMLGELRRPYEGRTPDLSMAKPWPQEKGENIYFKGTKEERKQQYKLALEKGEEAFDTEQDVANVDFELIENILYMSAVDHLVQKVYFVSTNHTFIQDYSDTDQNVMQLFGRMYYAVSIPLGGLFQGKYHIYIECGDVLYDTEKEISMK